MAEGKEQNRIVYLDPNNIPAIKPILEGGKYKDGVSPDNLTWNPEDYNICVDIKVIIPSREHKKGLDYEENALFNSKFSSFSSIFHGNDLTNKIGEKNFLTDDYTNVSYEEIRINGAGSREMLGVSSINIKFDAHLYPVVTIKFTDVRAASLMAPAEQAYVDKMNKQDEVCRNFFSALFRYPYPIFMLSVKGIYGTMVSFRLSTYDFKSSYNADTGNFDVTVQFIGSMYGIYTDIPFKLILSAPYIGARNGSTNDYWEKQTQQGGRFFYNDNGHSGGKIKTFIEYYRDSVNALKNGNDIIDEGEEGLASMRENRVREDRLNGILEEYMSLIDDNSELMESLDGRLSLPIHGKADNGSDEDEFFIVFFNGNNGKIKEESHGGLKDKAENLKKNCSDLSIRYPKICDDIINNNFKLYGPYINEDGGLTADGENIGHNLSYVLENLVEQGRCRKKLAYKYDDNFKDAVNDEITKLSESNRKLKKQASKEMLARYRSAVGFEPTIENAFRMLFAHIDTFMHLFYGCIENIPDSRKLGDFGVKIDETDIDSTSENPFMPPFTGFYRKSTELNGRPEEFYPGDSGSPDALRKINEVTLINDIFSGMESIAALFPPESEDSEDDGSSVQVTDGEANQRSFNIREGISTLIPTDIFYEGKNPYNILKPGSEEPERLFHFFLARCYALEKTTQIYKSSTPDPTKYAVGQGGGGSAAASDAKNDILAQNVLRFITEEFEMLVHSDIWKKIISAIDESSDIYLNYNVDKTKPLENKEFVYNIKKYFDEKPLVTGKQFCPIDESGNTRQSVLLLNDTHGYSRETIEQYGNIIRNGWQNPKMYPIPLSKSRSASRLGKTAYVPFYDINCIESCEYNEHDIRTEGEKTVYYFDYADTNEFIDIGYNDIPEKANIKDFNGLMRFIDENPSWPLWIPYVSYYEGGLMAGDSIEIAQLNNYFFYIYWNTECINGKSDAEIDYRMAAYLFLKQFNDDGWSFLLNQLRGTYNSGAIVRMTEIEYLITGSILSCGEDKEVKKIKRLYRVDSIEELSNIKMYFEKWSDKNNENGFIKIFRALKAEKESKTIYIANIKRTRLLSLLEEIGHVRVFDPNGTFMMHLTNMFKKIVYVLYLGEDKFLNDQTYTNTFLAKEFLKRLNDVIDVRKKDAAFRVHSEDGGTNILSAASDNPLSHNDSEAQRLSTYRTLKSLYDRWVSTYRESIWRLNTPEVEEERKKKRFSGDNDANEVNEGVVSEFDSFLYIDKFFNDISKKFIFNPMLLNKLIESEMDKSTDHSILSFISEFCRQNRLLFKCLPIYNNLYNRRTLTDAFTPMSPYSGKNRMRKGEGNTYIIMYPSEPSKNLNLPFNASSGVGYKDDGIDLADSLGNPTDEAKRILNGTDGNSENNYSVCAFGVTPNAQNQAYFTKVSVGMDNPKVTEQSIGTLFEISRRYSRGGVGTGVGAGQDIYSIYSNRSYDCRVDMMGCANIMPMMYFQLNNLPMFKGAYMIMSVEHNIQNNMMTTSFVGQRQSKYLTPLDAEIFNVAGLSDIVSSGEFTNSNATKTGYDSANPINEGDRDTWRKRGKDKYGFDAAVEISSLEPMPAPTFYPRSAVRQLNRGYHYATESRRGTRSTTEKSTSLCASSLKAFLWAGFYGYSMNVDDTKNALDSRYVGPVGNGYSTWSKLESMGFRIVAAGSQVKGFVPPNLAAGDVAVMKHGEMGHVCMWTGTQWVSDFTQKNYWVYPHSKQPEGPVDLLIYRYYGTIDRVSRAMYVGSPKQFSVNDTIDVKIVEKYPDASDEFPD